MPGRPATWIERIPVIQTTLETSTADRISRQEVEKLFAVSATRAKQILSVAGGTCGEQGWSISRVKLLDYVKFCPEAQQFKADQERQVELAKKLQAAEKDLSLRAVPIPVMAGDSFAKLDDVLPQFSFEPGVVRIAHDGHEDLVRTLYRLVCSLGVPGALEKFAELVDTKEEKLNV